MNTDASAARQLAPESSQAPVSAQSQMMTNSEQELRRLEAQAMFLRPATRDFLERVGITPGMRVLDVGCGAGDVSFVTEELVGPTGEVIGFDRVEAAVSTANARAQAKGLKNVRFVPCDIDHVEELAADRPFDAVVGRLVIMNTPNALDTIRKLLRVVRPGGVVGFQEVDLGGSYWSTHKLTALDKLHDIIGKMIELGMASGNLSSAFVKAFDEAGITNRRIIRSGAVESSSEVGVFNWLGGFARSFNIVAAKLGLPTLDFGSMSFDEMLRSEVQSQGAVFIPVFWIGAVGRLPHIRPIQN